MPLFIHEAAKRLGTTPRAIRFYQEKGLIAPGKSSENGYRLYDEPDLVRLRWIVALRELGLPVAAIRGAMPSYAAAHPGQADNLDSVRSVCHADAADTDTRTPRSAGPGGGRPDADAGADVDAGGLARREDLKLLARLDEARQQLYREWTDLSRALGAIDRLLGEGFARKELSLEALESAAAAVREAGHARSSWRDRWNYDRLAASYRGEAVLHALASAVSESQYELAHEAVLDWLDPAAGEHGLDLGAGTGRLTARLAAAGAAMTAVEQSAEMLAVLRELLPDADARQGNLLALPFREPAFGFVSCAFALHHLDLRQQLLALEEIDRVLVPGGRLCFCGVSLARRDDDAHESTTATAASEPETADSIAAMSPIGYPLYEVRLADRLREMGYEVIMPEIGESIRVLCGYKTPQR